MRTTDQGFLCDYSDWDENVARQLASRIPLQLTEEHWQIVRFARDYYQQYQHLPNMRMFVKAIRSRLGDEIGNSRNLYRLFPESPLKQAFLIAGLPKPPSCI
jgi:tRNA 2-thiouridine synthesizing protein E